MGRLCAISTHEDVCDSPTRIERMQGALTAPELAKLLGFGRTYIYEVLNKGMVPYFRLPTGAIRLDPVRVAVWLRDHEVGAAEQVMHERRAA